MCCTWRLFYLTNYILGGCVGGEWAEESTPYYTCLFNLGKRFISKVPTQTASTTQYTEFPDMLQYSIGILEYPQDMYILTSSVFT